MGIGKHGNQVNVINFGLAKKFHDSVYNFYISLMPFKSASHIFSCNDPISVPSSFSLSCSPTPHLSFSSVPFNFRGLISAPIPVGFWSFRWSKIWQEGLLIFSILCILSPLEFGHSGIETGMVPGLTRTECNQNPIVCLIIVCSAIVCLTSTFIHVTKHSDNTLSSHHHQPSSPSPPFVTAATCHECPLWAKRHVGPPHQLPCHTSRLSNHANTATVCHVTTMATTTPTHNMMNDHNHNNQHHNHDNQHHNHNDQHGHNNNDHQQQPQQ